MYDEDPMDSSDKCDHCEMRPHCTTQKKDNQFCFDPTDEDVGKLLERKMRERQ